MSIGAQIGDGLQKFGTSLVTKILGMGDYHLQSDVNSIKKNGLFLNGKMPMSFASASQGILMTNSEYLGPIRSSETIGEFKLDSYPLQPLNKDSFPWLSQFSDAFERYEVEGVVYRFESLSGVAVSGTDSSLGTIAAYFHYDPNDNPAASKAEMLQYSSSVSAKTSQSLLIGAECDPTLQVVKQMYVDDKRVTSDKRFSSKGFFGIASEGVKASGQVLGELWIHYKIRFHIPKINPARLVLNPGDILVQGSFNRNAAAMTGPFEGLTYDSEHAIATLVPINVTTLRVGELLVGEIYTLALSISRELAEIGVVTNPGYKLVNSYLLSQGTKGYVSIKLLSQDSFDIFVALSGGTVSGSLNTVVTVYTGDLLADGPPTEETISRFTELSL